jgi:peptidoglycan/LPS O-acetylase OafA/YrhL
VAQATEVEHPAGASLAPDPEATVVRIPGLDGIRALGIALVLAFHGGLSWATGGFLGVDVFFVLSGFLITGLLVAEFRQHRGIALGRFWAHRVRRLLPALLAMLCAVAVVAGIAGPADTLGQLRSDGLATLLYVNNWHQILGGQGYFAELATPRPLLHAWSLSIEEQFYLLWPLVVLGVLRLTRSLRALLVVTLGGAMASAVAMALLFHPGLAANRAYFGTDTRVQALLLGAALAIVLARPLGRSGTQDPSGALVRRFELSAGLRVLLIGIGIGGLVVVGWMAASVDATTQWPYFGGFGLLSLATAGLIASVALVPDSPLAQILSTKPVRYVGAISYGLYLWHWPLYVLLDHGRTGLSGLWLLAVRLLASFAVAIASYHLLEMPIRRGALPGRRGAVAALVAIGLTVALLLVATTGPSAVPPASGSGLSTSEQRALVDAGAFAKHPVRFMLFGDSVATTMALGLRTDARSRWGVEAQFTHTDLGCDLDPADTIVVSGATVPASPGCRGWEQAWSAAVAREHPEVVGVLLGRWEIVDRLHDGRWVHIGQPAWDLHLARQLDRAIGIFSSHGAATVLFTMPYVSPPEAPDGSTWPEDEPARVDAYNRLVRSVAASHPGEVTVVDLNRMVGPDGDYASTVDGVVVRNSDGIHFTKEGGLWLRPRILPTIGRIGLSRRG